MGRRILSYLIDSLFGFGLFVILFLGAAETVEGVDSSFCTDVRDAGASLCAQANDTAYVVPDDDEATVIFPPIVLFLANTIVLQGVTGASVGKHLLGLRVINANTFERAGFGRNLGRSLLLVVDAFCCFLIGLITALASNRHRRVGDMAAGTLVVGKKSVGQAPQPAYGGTQWASAAPPPSWDPSGSAPTWSPPAPSTPPPPGPAGATWSPPGGPAAAPPEPVGWSPPDVSPPGPPPAPAPATAPGVAAPVWDDARNTYIQWDPELNAWMMWDDVRKTWVPISQ